MKQQSRDTILLRIEKYLKNNLREIKGVRGFDENDRIKGLIKRLAEFSPIETLSWNVPDRKLFRTVAIAAGIQFVRQYPMLYHTPNSLRACFGMPTRTDRKKGRFSSIYFRNEAIERQLRPRTKDLDILAKKISTYMKENSNKKILIMNNYIEKAKKRNYVNDIIDIPESDHSEHSILYLKEFLEKYGFSNLIEGKEINEEKEDHLQESTGIVLAPDLIGYWNEKECWIELKEYREQQFSFKVIFQIFRYLLQNPFVILISTIELSSFEELKKLKILEIAKLRSWGKKQQENIQKELFYWNETRKSYIEIGRALKLNPRLEAIILTLTNEIVTSELGLINSELKSIEKFLEVTDSFKEEIIIQDFDEFFQERRAPYKQPFLLLKTDYRKEERK